MSTCVSKSSTEWAGNCQKYYCCCCSYDIYVLLKSQSKINRDYNQFDLYPETFHHVIITRGLTKSHGMHLPVALFVFKWSIEHCLQDSMRSVWHGPNIDIQVLSLQQVTNCKPNEEQHLSLLISPLQNSCAGIV